MALLAGSVAFERFHVTGDQPNQFGPEHIEILEQHVAGQFHTSSTENVHVGFLGGDHLFDQQMDLEKNVFNDALHCAVRIDSNQIPSAVRKAWLQMELAALMVDNPGGRPKKAQRQEAKEAVEQRCADEAASGKYHKMQQFPVLWDATQSRLYFGGSSASASELCGDLFTRAFDVELDRITSGKLARQWAHDHDRLEQLDEVSPSHFHPESTGEVVWWNNDSSNFDYLGNEFLLWLWWYLDTQSDTVALPDQSDVTIMLTRTLSLECPRGENGKQTISAVSPVELPEARRAIQTGKLPRKTGMSLFRYGQQFDIVLQAETFAISGAKIQADEDAEGRVVFESRIDAIRNLAETVDLLFHAFCERRIGAAWAKELDHIHRWLKQDKASTKKPAA
ncbi:MAG: hypothetical protein KDA59_03720 [Planctomycetales bacterium]|nr:hypothetical protein [Planctomycetales bacterium]